MLEHSMAISLANADRISHLNEWQLPISIETHTFGGKKFGIVQQPSEWQSLDGKISASILKGKGLAEMKIKPRETIIGPWFREGSLGYIFGIRGSGKTWFAWKMAISVSKGEKFGPWICDCPRKVLYIDGEMALESMRERMLSLDAEASENLMLLSYEHLGNLLH